MHARVEGSRGTLPRKLPYSGKLSQEKTFANFVVLWMFAKVFSMKFGGVASFGAAQVSNLQKFSPSKVSRYTGEALKLLLRPFWNRSRGECYMAHGVLHPIFGCPMHLLSQLTSNFQERRN